MLMSATSPELFTVTDDKPVTSAQSGSDDVRVA